MRLIDAEPLVMHLSDYALQESPGWGADDRGNKAAYDAISNCILAVQEAPTVEAVAIVKCRDCRYFRATDPVDTFVDGGLCTVFKDGDRYTMSYSFCFYGRRKDDHEDS